MSQPVVSVVVVSDLLAGTPGWADDIRHCLGALAKQDFDEPVEYIVSEWEGFRDRLPADLDTILPGVRIVLSPARTCFELKNEGAARARADVVALLDADCDPVPGWLRSGVETLRENPDVAVVSGRTLSPSRTRGERITSLAGRAVGDEGGPGPTRHIALNNIFYRRPVLMEHPLSGAAGSCGFAFNAALLINAGHRLWFEPRMEVVHDEVDFDAVRDVRRQMGISLILTRKLDPGHPHAWLLRLGYLSIPLFVAGKTILTAKRIVARRGVHGVRWYEVPAAVAVGYARHLLEVPGMVAAFRGSVEAGAEFR